MKRLFHRLRGHIVTYHPPLVPDKVIRTQAGKPLINVFTQDTFQRPDAHYECSCGETW